MGNSSNTDSGQTPQRETGYGSRIERRHARMEQRRAARANHLGGPLLGGLVLIALGIIFLLQNMGADLGALGNAWALLILIPAIGAFGTAWTMYRASGHLTEPARSSLVGGLVLTLVAAILFFNLDWAKIWPVFLILIGLGALLGASSSSGENRG